MLAQTANATERIKAVLDSMWNGEFPKDSNPEEWVITQLRAALGELGESWIPPSREIKIVIEALNDEQQATKEYDRMR